MKETPLENLQTINTQTIRLMLDSEIYLDLQISKIFRQLRDHFGYSRITLADYNQNENTFIIRVSEGWTDDYNSKGMELKEHNSTMLQAVKQRKTIYIPDVDMIDGYSPIEPSTRSELNIPLINGNFVFAVINIQATSIDDFTSNEIHYLNSAAEEIGNAISNRRFVDIIRGV